MVISSDLTAVILAGGFGRRLQTVTSTPKSIIDIFGKPFIYYVLEALVKKGIQSAVICTGYRARDVERATRDCNSGLDLTFSVETEPLGTGGALRQAATFIRSNYALVLNGDSYCDWDLPSMCLPYKFQSDRVTLVAGECRDCSRYGRIIFNDSFLITSFCEKDGMSLPGWINAGIYLLLTSRLSNLPKESPLSLEKQVFPAWLTSGLYAFPSRQEFLDIGTPESFMEKEGFIARLCGTKE